MTFALAIDIGGTFTDLVGCNLETGELEMSKSSTTYDDFGRGMFDCLSKVSATPAQARYVKHGTTLVINTLLQRSGARTALITTKGFRDVLEIGRGNRTQPFNLKFRRDDVLIPRDLRFEIAERMTSKGDVSVALDTGELRKLAGELERLGIEAVAIAFLNAYANPQHEEAAAAFLRGLLPNVYISTSTALSREWFEFERTATVAANAYVGPLTSAYVSKFNRELRAQSFEGSLLLMGSHGGVLSAARVQDEPIALVESGPAGGCIGAGAVAAALGLPNIIAFDMGGTTAKCSLIEDGRFEIESTYHIGGPEKGFPIRGSVVDIIEVGAGGGSIAWIDEQGRLNVGPRSAGSTPGPVSYGKGGEEPTVTDANLVLGRIDGNNFLGGEMSLSVDLAREAITTKIGAKLGFGEADSSTRSAQGVLTIANVTMAEAIKQISITRGCDPRDFALFAYGGGGPLHGADLARELNIPTVIVPPDPGTFSALGMLLADARLDHARTFIADFRDEALAKMRGLFVENEKALLASLMSEFDCQTTAFERRAELRYKGQKHTIRIEIPNRASLAEIRLAFDENYQRRYGHSQKDATVEFVTMVSTALVTLSRPQLTEILGKRIRPGSATVPVNVRPVYDLEQKAFLETAIYSRASLPEGFSAQGPAMIEEYGSTTRVGPNDVFTIGQLGEIRIDCSN